MLARAAIDRMRCVWLLVVLCASAAVDGDAGSKLMLTPYIESGNIDEARNLAAVKGEPFPADIPSYAGYLTVNKQFNSNLFFWFFPAEQDFLNAPVLLWLNGGPGSSSLFGLFTELGPFSVAEDNASLVLNPYSWHKNHSIVFFDNPVGTGFSFTDFDEGYATNQTQIGAELYTALLQFFTLFPELQDLPFFLTGESYAGKYIPALGFTIHNNNPTADLKLNLQGISVGNGFTDPLTLLSYSLYLYELGFVDTNTYNSMKDLEEKCKSLIQEENYMEAAMVALSEMSLFNEATKYTNIYNFLFPDEPRVGGSYDAFVQRDDVRRALHVGDEAFTENGTVFVKLIPDLLVSARPFLEPLLDHYRVLYYNGQLDIIVGYALSVNMFLQLQFDASEEYRNATRQAWYVDGQLAGYMKTGGNFTEVLVRNAGHMVPTDQPAWAFDLINRFTSNNLVTGN
ncbi:venom serine carboxypeptidase-like [Periplaneta americana]|uniref:venom serine carboxypeptidase-like n=1 Tax=Periplaneta americana TaxID=6978 RepID=UPI0037E96421